MYICSVVNADILCTFAVAPHTGAWIEIAYWGDLHNAALVAPHTGAWIEIISGSTPAPQARVAPHTGAWIEIIRR